MASSSKQNTSELGVKESKEESNTKTEALHSFRTITTMLSLIQSKGSTAGNQPKLGRQEKILLQLLDAFAAVLGRNNGVIAVTAQPYDGSGKVEIPASYLGNGDSLTISQPQSSGPLINLIWNVFVSQNPRNSTVKQQTLVDPEKSVPKSFKKIEEPLKLLKTFLTEIW